MKPVLFGRSGLSVSPLGLGGAQLGGVFGHDGRERWEHLVRSAVDAGVTFFDTADSYTQGESERLLGKALGAQRKQVILATKVGYRLPPQKRLGGKLKPLLRPLVRRLGLRRDRLPSALTGSLSQDFSAAYITSAAEQSLRRLRTDYLDIYQLHSPPTSVIEAHEWQDSLERLKQAGKIRSYGIACHDADGGYASLKCRGISSLQLGVSLLEQQPIDGIIGAAESMGIGVIARQPFAAGFLTRPFEALDPLKLGDCNWSVERSRITRLRELAAREGLSPAAFAIRFVRGISGVSVTVIGISSHDHLKENLRLFEEPPLPASLFAKARSMTHEPDSLTDPVGQVTAPR